MGRYAIPSNVHGRGCGCRWCETGTAVPLEQARPEDMARLLLSEIENAAGVELEVAIRHRLPEGGSLLRMGPVEVVVSGGGLTWTLDAAVLEEIGGRRWRL